MIEGQLVEDVRQDRVGRVVRHQGVAVRRGLRDLLRADRSGGACLVLHEEALPGLFGELLCDAPRHLVYGASGRIRHDDADRLRGVVTLRACGTDGSAEGCRTQCDPHGLA